jgi:hypothetical protein
MSRRVPFFSVVAAALVVAPAASVAAEQKAVVELFTSQGCSSCPPADRLAADLARDPRVVVLSLPVDYWDYLGWKDTLASPRSSARQRAYSKVRGDRDVYTPQVVVNGSIQVLGSDKSAIERAIVQSERRAMSIPVTLAKAGGRITVSVADGNGQGEVWLCGVARAVPVVIGRGENSGRTITYSNVGRKFVKLGDWSGKAQSWSVSVNDIADEGVDAAAVIVQSGSSDKPGPMLGAAFTAFN